MKARTVISTCHLVIVTEHHGRQSVLRLLGELDLSNRDFVRDAIDGALEHGPRVLVLDLSGLGFMDCSGLRVLVGTHKHLAEDRRQLFVAGSRPIVRRLIRLTGLDAYLRLGWPEAMPSTRYDRQAADRPVSLPTLRPPALPSAPLHSPSVPLHSPSAPLWKACVSLGLRGSRRSSRARRSPRCGRCRLPSASEYPAGYRT
jgi:anti-sigma B factor antagonist